MYEFELYEIEITLNPDLEIDAFARLAPSEVDTICEAIKSNTVVRDKRCIKEDPQALDHCGDPLCGASFTSIHSATHLNIKVQVNHRLVANMLYMMGCSPSYLYRL